MRVAIFTPNKNPYSETFIQAHKNFLIGKVFYYYGDKNNIKLEGQGVLKTSKVHGLQLRVKRKIFNNTFSYINDQLILRSLIKNKIDVILVEYGTHAHQLLPVLNASKVSFIVHFHGFDASVGSVVKSCNNYLDVFRSSYKIIAVSKKMKQMLLEIGCPENKLIYNVYGPQHEFEKVVPKFSKKQLIAIGRFTDKKAPYYTILAFKKVLEIHPDAILIMAGDGLLIDTCKNLVSYYKLNNSIKLIGIIKPEKYRELLEESVAFVQHSITATNGDMEGTPLAVLEASVAGLPVIATNHAGIPDVIVHGKTGLLCEEHDVSGMASNMIQVLDDVTYAQQLGAAGKQHILDNYNIERHIKVLNDCLASAV